jgi:flagellar biosynthesis protein
MAPDLYDEEKKKETVKGFPVAVALEAGLAAQSLPKVVASGRGLLAEQILKLAFECGVKVRQDADLAELLAQLDIDHEIPPEAIVPVAEILARVYEANVQMAEAEEKKNDAPNTF